jgi:hypothetical protein
MNFHRMCHNVAHFLLNITGILVFLEKEVAISTYVNNREVVADKNLG